MSFLQAGLRIFQALGGRQFRQLRGVTRRATAAAAASKPRIQEYGAEHRLQAHPPRSRPGESRRISIRRRPDAEYSPKPSSAAICARLSPLTKEARKRDRCAFVGLRVRIVKQARDGCN